MPKPVLIVGAGPVGLTLAGELVRYGISVRIIDKAPNRTDKSKALVVWSRTLELLDRGGGSVPFIDAGFKATGVNVVAGDHIVGHVGMEAMQTPYPFALMLPQSETERLLDERLNRLGASVEREVELLSFENNTEGITAVLRHNDGREERFEAGWMVGCDGAHSAVRHGLNAPFTGETMKSDWMLADIHMTGYPYSDNDASVFWHHDGVFVIFPIVPGRYRVIADLPPTAGDHTPTPTLQEVQAIIDRRGPKGLVASDPVWIAGFRVNGRKVAHYRYGKVFLAGDAAHVHSPAGGQGMNTGMQDAFNLAWKLACVIQNKCGDHLLDSFTAERSAVGDMVLKTAAQVTTIGTLKNPILQVVRNVAGQLLLGLTPFQHAFANNMSEVTIGYPSSPRNGPALGHHPRPGERIVPAQGDVPVGSGPTPLFALFGEKTSAVDRLLNRFPGLLDPNVRQPLHAGGIWLVRPDGYVACSSADTDPIADYLDKLICT